MAQWQQEHIFPHMHVYSSDQQDVGQVTETYKDSFEFHKGLFSKHHYIPYELVTTVENNRVQVNISAKELAQMKWEIRPDYEHHEGDPTQLFYDRGHGIHDPFEET